MDRRVHIEIIDLRRKKEALQGEIHSLRMKLSYLAETLIKVAETGELEIADIEMAKNVKKEMDDAYSPKSTT